MVETQHDKAKKFHFLSTVCDDQMPLYAKIASFTLQHQKDPPSLELIILVLEYLQVAAQTLLFNSNIHSTTVNEGIHSLLVAQLAEFFQPGFLFKPEEDNSIIFKVVLVLLSLYSIFKYLLFGYIIVSSIRRKEPGSMLIKIWRWIYKLQTRVIYVIVTSFWLNAAISAAHGTFIVFGVYKKTTIITFTTLMIIEFLLCFLINRLYRFLLPRKSLFSSKDSLVETITLCQKFVLQIIGLTFALTSYYNYWIGAAFNIAFNLGRIIQFYTTLPNYNINGLYFKGFLIAVLSALDLACITQQIREYQIERGSWTYILVLWIVLSVLTVKVSFGYLNKALLKLVSGEDKCSSNLLIHKISVIKQLVKESKYHQTRKITGYSSLVRKTLMTWSNIETTVESETKENLKGAAPKKILLAFYMQELEEMMISQPKNELLKLYIAGIYMKKSNMIGSAIKYLIALENSSNKIIGLNASLLMNKVQEMLRTGSRKEKKEIIMYIYFKTQADFAQLKKKMLKQNNLQHKICQEILEDCPNLGNIRSHSQSVYRYRQEIEKKTKVLLAAKPDYYVEPFQLLAVYHLTMNHSLIEYLEYSKNYFHQSQKYKKEFQNVNLTPGNIYQDETAFVIASGQKEDLGRIVYCTSSISDIYGGEPNIYTTANILTLAPLHNQDFYSVFSFSTNEKTGQDFLGRTFRGLCRHREGYLIEIEYYINVLPFLTKGFYYCMIIRPVMATKDYLIVQENGNIEGVTKSLWRKLGLDKQSSTEFTNIKLISEDLYQANEAFNYVTLPEKYGEQIVEDTLDMFSGRFKNKTLMQFVPGKMDSSRRLNRTASIIRKKKPGLSLQKAKEIHNIFTTEGKELQLAHIQGDDSADTSRMSKEGLLYDCKMSVLSQAEYIVKLVTLEDKIKVRTDAKAPEQDIQQETINNIDINLNIKNRILNSRFGSKFNRFPELPPIETEDEKTAGWIDFEALLTRRSSGPLSPGRKMEERLTSAAADAWNITEINLLSPTKRTTDILLESPKRPTQKRQTDFAFDSSDSRARGEENHEHAKRLKGPDTARLSSRSKSSQDEKVSRAINLALTTKYHSRPIRILSVVFYILLVGVLVGEVIIKVILDNTIEDLQTKKDIITVSQTRDSALVTMQRSMRFIWDIGTGALTIPLLNKFGFTLNTYIKSGNAALLSLIEANQAITSDMGTFDESIRQFLYNNDVSVFYDDNVSLDLTSVQATDEVIEIGIKAIAISKKNVSAGATLFNFLFRNALNDLLIKNEADSAVFLNSIDQQVTTCKTGVYIILGLLAGLLIVMLIAVTLSIIDKYKEEKAYLTAITKLDNREIKKAQDKLDIFKKVLEADRLNENKTYLRMLQSTKMTSALGYNQNSTYIKNVKTPNHSQILKQSSITIVNTVFIHLVLIGLMILNSLEATHIVGYLKTEQSKLYVANGMAKEISLAYLEVQELFGSNGTALIRNQTVDIQIQDAVVEINTLKNTMMETFQNSDRSFDPVIEMVLFGQSCATLVNSSSTNFCGFLANQSIKISLITLLSNYEAQVTTKIQKFYQSNKTMPTLRAIQVEDADVLLATLRVMYDQCNMIANRTNILFGEEFDQAKSRGVQILTIIVFVLVFMAWFTWIFVFRRLIETENAFKNVLQTFSPNLILSNFILKSFIIRTARGALDSVKNEFV